MENGFKERGHVGSMLLRSYHNINQPPESSGSNEDFV